MQYSIASESNIDRDTSPKPVRSVKSPEEISSLVGAYIERYAKKYEWDKEGVLRDNDVNFWAWEEFDRLIREEPESAWAAILGVVNLTTDEYVLGILGAGPLEDLIDAHGEAFVSRIVELANGNANFKEVLRCVWRSSTPAVWKQIEVAQEADDTDES